MGRVGRWAPVGALVALVAVAIGVGWVGPVGAQGGATATVSLAPDPPVGFEPFTVAVTGQGCQPGATVTAELYGSSTYTDVVEFVPVVEVQVVADGGGSWLAELPVSQGMPTHYMIVPGCGLQSRYFEVPTPPGFTATASPATVTLEVLNEIQIAGVGCPSTEVVWEVGVAPIWGRFGSVAVAADGTWAGTAAFTGPTSQEVPSDRAGLRVACVVGGINVEYDVIPLQVLPAPTTTTTTTLPDDDGDSGDPVVPRFTG